MKIMKNLFLSVLVLVCSTTLEAWVCSGCQVAIAEGTEQSFRFCQENHLYCAPCAVHMSANQCTQCNRYNGNNVDGAINAALQNGPRCHNCRSLFNATHHRRINPEPCHHSICVSCAHNLLQNKGYAQRSTHHIHRAHEPRFHNIDDQPNMPPNIMHDNVLHESSQAYHFTAAQCPIPGCQRAFTQATCQQIDIEYNNHAIGMGRYIWNKFGSNDKERVFNTAIIGGTLALIVTAVYRDYKAEKEHDKKTNSTPRKRYFHIKILVKIQKLIEKTFPNLTKKNR